MLTMALASDPVDGFGDPSEPVNAAQSENEGRSVPWYELGACRGMDTNMFFPHRGEKVPDEVREACGSCIVREECETAGLAEFGVWGGLSERARRRIHQVRRRGAEKNGVAAGLPQEYDDPTPAGEAASRPDGSSAA